MKYDNARFCPICLRELTHEHKIKYQDYHCFPPPVDHHYAERIKDGELIAMKVRVSPAQEKIFFKIDLLEKTLEVWTIPNDKEKRIKVSNIFTPDFSDLPSLFHKMKTYLIFS